MTEPVTGVHITPGRVNPIASLYPHDLEIDFGRHHFLIPAQPAAWWLEYLLADPPQLDIFPDCLSEEDQVKVEEAIIDADVTAKQVNDIILAVLEVASGRRWWITIRICVAARGAWDLIGGQLALAGVDVHAVPLGAWLDAAYRAMLQNIADSDPKKATTFVSAIQAPPAGFEDELDEEAEAEAFLAAMQQV